MRSSRLRSRTLGSLQQHPAQVHEVVVEAIEPSTAPAGAQGQVGDIVGRADTPDDLRLVRIGQVGAVLIESCGYPR